MLEADEELEEYLQHVSDAITWSRPADYRLMW